MNNVLKLLKNAGGGGGSPLSAAEAEPPNWDDLWLNEQMTGYTKIPGVAMRLGRILEEIGKISNVKSITDFGCGIGELLLQIRHKYQEALSLQGVDKSAFAVKIAKTRLPSALFQEWDLLADSARGGRPGIALADVGICCEVLEHVSDPALFLKNMAALLAPGGTAIVTVPAGPMCVYDKHIGHLRHFSRGSLAEVMAPYFDGLRISGLGVPFFNLYRMLRAARGGKMITDAKIRPDGRRSLPVEFVSGVLCRLIKHLSLSDSRFGLNLIAIGRRR